MEERDSTMAVLLDISATRRAMDETLEKLTEIGLVKTKPADIPDGLDPSLRPLSDVATQAIRIEPTWATTLYATVMHAISTRPDNAKVLRTTLLQVASTAVNWIEVLDERIKN